jgi:hypothetical protein
MLVKRILLLMCFRVLHFKKKEKILRQAQNEGWRRKRKDAETNSA